MSKAPDRPRGRSASESTSAALAERNGEPGKQHRSEGRDTVFVLGGAGYVGSNVVKALLSISPSPTRVVIIDNLSRGHAYNVSPSETARTDLTEVIFEECDVRHAKQLGELFAQYMPCAVFNFCGSIEVGLSMKDPMAFYDNNVGGMTTILACVKDHNVPHLVFSSTAAVYGTPARVPIPEDAELHPENPYGDTKLASERMLHWADKCHGIKSVSLRYFNASGADPSGTFGEDHAPESHLIPLVLQVAAGKRENISLFGDDYPTKDGTCVRDYVHVTDLAAAHVLAWRYLQQGGETTAFNLGNGVGHSVAEVIDAARAVTGHPIPTVVAPRRRGDPAALVASSIKANKILGWRPEYPDIIDIVRSAWNWHQTQWIGVHVAALVDAECTILPVKGHGPSKATFVYSVWRRLPDGPVQTTPLRVIDPEAGLGSDLQQSRPGDIIHLRLTSDLRRLIRVESNEYEDTDLREY